MNEIWCTDCKQRKPVGKWSSKAQAGWCVDCWQRRTDALAAATAPGADFAAVQAQFRRDKRAAKGR